MLSLGAMGFAAPLALLALASLPVLYLLLRATPPTPRRTSFPPMRLLMDTEEDEETPRRTPLWLVVLRLLIAALVIVGLARPILFPREAGAPAPLLIVVDDDWAAAPNWERTLREAQARIDMADGNGQVVTLAFTAPRADAPADIVPQSAETARQRLATHAPAPWAADRIDAAARLAAADLPQGQEALYLTNGAGGEGMAELLAALRDHGGGGALALTPQPLDAPLALRPPAPTAQGFEAQIMRADPRGARQGEITALTGDGRLVARAQFSFADGESVTDVAVEAPPELRQRTALVRVSSSPSAGAAAAIGDAWRRPDVGIAEDGARDAQPLLSDFYYLERALQPFAEARRDTLENLLAEQPGVIALVDGAGSAGAQEAALRAYVREGGVLIRFAGPLLSSGADPVLPVRLRQGGRDFAGALAWGEPQHMAPFADTSPFAGLATLDEVTVSRQVLAEPEAELTSKTWARLEDGTPLVTAERDGQGWIVLFHVTAGPDWSSLPLSGLYPQMLQRVTSYAEGGTVAGQTGAVWAPDRMLTAEGRLAPPPPEAQPIPAAEWETATPGPRTPPGLYARAGALEGLNIAGPDFTLTPFAGAAGVAVETFGERAPRPLAGSFLLLALLLLAADAVAALLLSGRLRGLARRLRPRRAAGALGALLLAAALIPALPGEARAQEAAAPPAGPSAMEGIRQPPGVEELRLAYVRTGDTQVDRMSHAGLTGLAYELIQRTSVEPGEPVGLNLETDDLVFFPLIYWPVTQDAAELSPAAAARLEDYVRAGGTVLVDTQDAGSRIAEGDSSAGLQRALTGLDVPPLTPAQADHVLTKAFYLMEDFPGRWTEGRLWVEAETASGARDGVSGFIVGGNDWSAAWAVDDSGRPLAAMSGGGARQREMAYRFGVNLVMYVLTGNYKADQVHIPDLLQRLGQ